MEDTSTLNFDENENNINTTNIEDAIIKENNLFKLLALFGRNNLQNILTFYPGFNYSKLFKIFLQIFEDYNNDNNDANDKSFKIVKKIIKRFNADYPLKNLIESLSLKEKERKLILAYGITNKPSVFFFNITFHIKTKN